VRNINAARFNGLTRKALAVAAKMAKRSYSEMNLHITWHTKDNLPMITKEIEAALYKFLRKK